jgi:hypothetical protein
MWAAVVGQSRQLFQRPSRIMLSEKQQKLHQELGIPADYGQDRHLP